MTRPHRNRGVLTAAAALALATLCPLAAGGVTCDPSTWAFDESTTGEDILWTSPDAVINDAPRYDLAYEISLLEVTVTYLFLEFTVDVTDQVPPELRSGSGIVDGPPPIILFQDRIVFPAPPDPPGFEADIDFRIDGDGFGRLAMTDVLLGELEVELPVFGLQTVQLEGVRLAGQLTVTPIGPRADVNADGIVDFGDILVVLANYEMPGPEGDANGDGFVDFSDILQILADWGMELSC